MCTHTPIDVASSAPPEGVKQGMGAPSLIAENKFAAVFATNEVAFSETSFTTGVVTNPAAGPPIAPVVPDTSSLQGTAETAHK